MSRFLVAAAASLTAVAVTGAATAGGAETPTRTTVRINDIDFRPERVTIRRGGSVRWLFLDGQTSHNVRSRGRLRFRGSPTKQEGSYHVTFKRAGTYRYVCTLHLNMKGTVVVR